MSKFLLAVVAAVLLVAGCGRAEPEGDLSGRSVRVVATTGMIADAVREIGGERVEVEALMGPGIDPHLYKASEGDVRRVEQADAVFFNGLHLEAKMADVLERLEDRAFAVTDGIPRERLVQAGDFEGAYDPHVWFDVELWQLVVEELHDRLVEVDGSSASLYRENADAYLEELEELNGYVEEQVAQVPKERRVLVTAHDAFEYFGRAYDFEVRGLQGISTAAEAGAGDVQALADFIAERRIPAIFVESSVAPRTLEAVREAVRSRGFEVEIGGSLYSDAMGDEGTEEGTYLGMVRHNLDEIVSALNGAG